MIDPTTAIEICRFLHDGALLLLWGSAAFLAFLTPDDLARQTWRRLGPAPFMAAIVAAVTTVVSLPLEAAAIGNGWPDAVNPETLRAVLMESSVGTAWQAQILAGTVLLLAFLASGRRRLGAVAGASALAIAALTLNGHASTHQGWLSAIHRSNDIVHMLSGGGWLGALIPLIMLLRKIHGSALQPGAVTALRRFSTAGHVAVALVLISGVVNTFLVLGQIPADWSSHYQRLLTVKILAVLAMIGVAVINRYRFVPAMADNPDASIRAIRLGSIFEIAIGLIVIGLVAIFGMLDPV